MSAKKTTTPAPADSIAHANKWFIRIAFTFWALFAVLDYVTHQKFFVKAFSSEWHTGAFLLLFVFHAGFLYLHKKAAPDKSGITVTNFTGWKIALYLHFFFLVLLYTFGKATVTYTDANAEFAFKGMLHILVPEVLLLVFVTAVYALGYAALQVVPLPLKGAAAFLFCIVAGFMGWGLLLFAAAWFHILNLYAVLVIAALSFAAGYKGVVQFFKTLAIQKTEDIKLSWFSVVVLFVFAVSAAINLLAFFRPFPIGFDELQWYFNIPNLISQSGSLLPGNSAYYWSLIMSVGFVTADSVPLVSWLASVPGIISALLVYHIARYVLSKEWSLVSAVLFYVLPTVVWHSAVDAKVDLTLTMFFLTAVNLLLQLAEKTNEESFLFHTKIKTTTYINAAVWLGAICGFCMGIKYTSFIFLPAIVAGYVYVVSKQWMLSAATLPAVLAALFVSNAYSITGITFGSSSVMLLTTSVMAITALAFTAAAVLKNRSGVWQATTCLLPLGISAFLLFAPWLVKNFSETKTISASALLTGQSESPILIDLINPNRSKPALKSSITNTQPVLYAQNHGQAEREEWMREFEKRKNEKRKQIMQRREAVKEEPTASYEEKERYTGYKKGIMRYVSVLRDVCTQANVASFPNDAGLVVLVFLPLLFFRKGNNINSLLSNVGGLILLLVLTSLSILSANKGVVLSSAETIAKINESTIAETSSTILSFYGLLLPFFTSIAGWFKPVYVLLEQANFTVSVVFLSGFAALLVVFQHSNIKQSTPIVKLLLVIAGISAWLWWLLGNGIVWYALPALALAPLACFRLVETNLTDQYLLRVSYAVVGLFLLLSVVLRSVSYIPTYDPRSRINDVFIRYAAGEMNSQEAFAENNKQFALALAEINAHPDARVLRIGTFANYFISGNSTRVIADNQLEAFDHVYNYAGNKRKLTELLKKAGVEYILYDLNSNAIDKTEEKTLTAKIKRLYQYLAENPDLQQIATDRVVASKSGQMQVMYEGKPTQAKYSVFGNTVIQKGTMVLFKVL